MSEYTKALEYYEKSIKIELKILGEEHENTAGSFYSIGSVY
jgi:hypothetical protein